jgi:rubredoxin
MTDLEHGGDCPECGASRLAAFRYCRSCGHDFEPADPSAGDVIVPGRPEGGFVTSVARGTEGLDGRRIEAFRPWRDD